MSAWVVSKKHVDLMVAGITFGTRDGVVKPSRRDRTKLGQMLVTECVTSVSYRYPDDNVEAGELPGPCDAYYVRPYEFEHPKYLPTAAELYKAVDCYAYQSNEHPGWKTSAAKKLCDKFKKLIEGAVPEAGRMVSPKLEQRERFGAWPAYEAAPWGFDVTDIAVCYAKSTDNGLALVRTVASNWQDVAAVAALSDWLMKRDVIDRPMTPDELQFRVRGLAE